MIVAYPGDETLWAGGHILMKSDWQWTVAAMFQSSDPDRSERFSEALSRLGAKGQILDLPDSTNVKAAPKSEIQAAVIRAVAAYNPDLLITHNPMGECARHHDRSVLGAIVARMWEKGQVSFPRLGIFAYEDNHGQDLPWADDNADWYTCLPRDIWAQKRDILLDIYGFAHDSFVVSACPREEAFYWFNDRNILRKWSQKR